MGDITSRGKGVTSLQGARGVQGDLPLQGVKYSDKTASDTS